MPARPRAYAFDIELGRVDDLGEDRDVVPRQVDRLGLAVEELRQILELFRPALHRHAVVQRQGVQVPAAAARHDDAVRHHGRGYPAAHQVGSHQRGHLHADFADLPGERRGLQAAQHAFQAFFRQAAGQEDDVFHVSVSAFSR